MAISTTFGFIVPQRGSLFGLGPLRDILRLGVDAEASGHFDTLWVGDSLTSKARPDSLSCLGALAGMTSTVRLGVGCMATFAVRDPALFAFQWATLDQISEGRMLLSVCNGLQPNGASAREGANFGGVLDRDRPERLEENIALCRALWRGEPTSFHGTFSTYEDIQILPTPVQTPCPIWMTANPRPGPYMDRVLSRVGRLADGWMTIYPGPSFSGLRDQIHSYVAAAGREPAGFPVALYHNVNIGSSRSQCVAETRAFADQYYDPGFLDPFVENMTAAGTPAECVEQLGNLCDQGADHIALRITSFDQRTQFHALVEEVLPALLS